MNRKFTRSTPLEFKIFHKRTGGNAVKDNRTSKPIRGSLEPFQGTEIVSRSKEIQGFHARGTNAPRDRYFELRNVLKEDIGELFRRGAKQCGRYKPISDDSRNIIQTYLATMRNHPHCSTFVNCVINSHNDGRRPPRLNPPGCKTTNVKKALQHANKDSLKEYCTYVKPIFRYMNEHESDFNDDALGRYRDVEGAVAFTRHLFMKLSCGRMPRTMSVELFNKAKKLDIRIAENYVYRSTEKKYMLCGKRTYMCTKLNQECITQIVCFPRKP